MRLSSITVRNYRMHGALAVELDRERTLIGGPNESGKSTLIEAAHRALFLRAKTGGETQKSMVSRIHAGHPEVEICFDAQGRSYRVQKRFSGASGTVTLTEMGGHSWSGEDAETRLAELLGVAALGSGRGAGDRVREQWAHLWIWQGCAGDDPTTHANTHCGALLARLQDEGGAAAIQSECDARVASVFAERHDAIFNRNGQPKAGSELARAIAAEAAAGHALAAAQQALARVEEAIADFHGADETIRAAERALEQLAPQLAQVEAQLGRVAALRTEEKVQAPTAAAAAEKHGAFALADARIRQLDEQLEKALAALAPAETKAQQLTAEEAGRRKEDAAAEEAWQRAGAAVRAARLRSELATAHLERSEKTTQRDQLAKRLDQVRASRTAFAALTAGLAQTPPVTQAKLRALQKIESERAEAGAALEAMAAGVEVIASDEPVRLGERTLAPGEAQILTEDAEVAIGSAIRLRIRPGGGTSLTEARARLHAAREKLQRELDALGLGQIGDAADAAARRQQLESDIKAATASLEALGAETIDEDFATAENARAAAEGEVARRAALIEKPPAPTTSAEAQSLARDCAAHLRDAERSEAAARSAREAAAKLLGGATERIAQRREALQEHKRAAAELQAQVRLLVQTHGEDAARATQLVALSSARIEAEARLDATRRALAELQPEALERDRTRLERALAQHRAAKAAAEERRALARGQLQRDGASDPHAEIALAEAALHRAQQQRERADRQAGAIRLLHELFVEEQQALAEQFTRPLAAKISGYLECLFGLGARAEVTLEADNFKGLRLIRPVHGDGAFEFDHLSGGTREQHAAAVRLALAEVLADAHGGCLPLVFDDAFAYSDPERVGVLQRMLDLAAGRGLQIIVLTCNADDYAGLGAKTITLRVARTVTAHGEQEPPMAD